MNTILAIAGILILALLVVGALRSKPIIEEGWEDNDGYHKGKQDE